MVTERRLVRPLACVPLCLLVGLTVVCCHGCSTVEIKTYWGPIVKYSDFGPTFAWVGGAEDAAAVGESLDELIVDTVEQELIGKGYVKNTSDDPELRLDYRVGRKERPGGTGFDYYEKGALILDIIDPGSGQRYWRGIAQARLYDDDAPDVRRKRVTGAIREMLAQFPAVDGEVDKPQG